MIERCTQYCRQGAMKSDAAISVWCAASAALQDRDALRDGLEEAISLKTSLFLLYEILLQNYLFAGFPAAIEGLSTFSDILRFHRIEFSPSDAQEYDTVAFSERGMQLCEAIYGNVFARMRASVSTMSPDLYSWMIIEGYGKTLSREEADITIRELAIIGVLSALGWQRQLFSHIRGSMNVGASIEEVRHAVEICQFLVPHRAEKAVNTFTNAVKR